MKIGVGVIEEISLEHHRRAGGAVQRGKPHEKLGGLVDAGRRPVRLDQLNHVIDRRGHLGFADRRLVLAPLQEQMIHHHHGDLGAVGHRLERAANRLLGLLELLGGPPRLTLQIMLVSDRQPGAGQRRPPEVAVRHRLNECQQITFGLGHLLLGQFPEKVAASHSAVQLRVNAFRARGGHAFPHIIRRPRDQLPVARLIKQPRDANELLDEGQMGLGIGRVVPHPVPQDPEALAVELPRLIRRLGPDSKQRCLHLGDVLDVGGLLADRAAVVAAGLLEFALREVLVAGPDVPGGVAAHLQAPQPTDDAQGGDDRNDEDENEPGIDSGCHC